MSKLATRITHLGPPWPSAFLVLALLLAGCTQQAGTTTKPTAVGASQSLACSASELDLALRFITTTVSGEMRASYALFNKGTRVCALSGLAGPPSVRLIGDHGVPLSVSFAVRPLDVALGTAAEPSRHVSPGSIVVFDLFWESQTGDAACHPARELRLSLPDSGGVLTASAVDRSGSQVQTIAPCDGRATVDVFH